MELSWVFFLESIALGVGLAMDAFSVSLADGMNEHCMRRRKMIAIAATFAIFQAAMPMIGWVCVHTIVEIFSGFEAFIPWIALALLVIIGGKMLLDGIKSDGEECECAHLGFMAVIIQAVATSIDALAVGVSLNMESHFGGGLLLGIFGSVGVIGCTTFLLSIIAVYIGKAVGNKLADKAQLLGGIVLICLGLKILIESFL